MSQENPYQPPQAAVADVAGVAEDEYASRWARLGAALIDGLLAIVVVFPLMFATGYWQQAMAGKRDFGMQLELAFVSLIAALLMHGYFLHTSGQTIGKRLVGIRVVAVDDNRILPLWKIFALRMLPVSVVAQVPVVGPLATLVDMLFIFRGDKRCIHDFIAGTKVVDGRATWKGQADLNDAD